MNEIRFIDLFSGIGGFRLGLENANQVVKERINQRRHSTNIEESEPRQQSFSGFKCVWSNDINEYANQIYVKRFGEEAHYSGDIRGVDAREIPDHDLLCGGFPCQAFSVAGKRKGFEDTRGTLFFEICRIAEAHRPSMLLLENVKGLLSHDGGRTFATITESLEELGYWWEYQVLNSKYFGVPQNRERVFIIGHSRNGCTESIFPITESSELLDQENRGKQEGWSGLRGSLSPTIDARYGALRNAGEMYIMAINATNPKSADDKRTYHLSNNTRALKTPSGNQESLVALRHVRTDRGKEARSESQKQGHDNTPFGEGFREFAPSKEPVTGTVTTGLNKDALIGHDMKIRRLTPIECERLQGFPDNWTEGVSDTQRYKCLGNAVTVNVIEYLGKQIRTKLSLCADGEI